MGLFAGTPFDVPAHCDKCGELESVCTCPAPPPFRIPPEKQTARLATEKRKRGKVVSVVQGLPAVGNDLPDLLTRLKTACGAGGTLKDDVIEIQGEHLPRIREVLQSLGFRIKG